MVDVVGILKTPSSLGVVLEDTGALQNNFPFYDHLMQDRILKLTKYVTSYKDDLYPTVSAVIGRNMGPGKTDQEWYHFFVCTESGAKLDFRCVGVSFVSVMSDPSQVLIEAQLVRKEMKWTHYAILIGVNLTTNSLDSYNKLYENFNVSFISITNLL